MKSLINVEKIVSDVGAAAWKGGLSVDAGPFRMWRRAPHNRNYLELSPRPVPAAMIWSELRDEANEWYGAFGLLLADLDIHTAVSASRQLELLELPITPAEVFRIADILDRIFGRPRSTGFKDMLTNSDTRRIAIACTKSNVKWLRRGALKLPRVAAAAALA